MFRPALLALAIAALSAPALASDYKLGAITIQNPWTRPAMAGMNGVGFLAIANTGSKPVKIMGAQSPAAGKIEIHRSAMANGVMTMRRQDDGVVVPAGGTLALAPGGYHLMLLALNRPLVAGQKIPVTLIFESGRRIAIDLTVQTAAPQSAAAAKSGKAADGAHHHHP